MRLKIILASIVLCVVRLAIKAFGPVSSAYLAERITLVSKFYLPEGSLTLLSGNSSLLYRAQSVRTKEPETVDWIDSFEKGSCLWDIGANVGVYSLYAARCRNAKVLAFEPAAANYQALNTNIELNNAHTNVQAYCLALSDTNELGSLNMTDTIAGGATNNFDKEGAMSPYARKTGKIFHQGMIGFSVDQFIEMFSPPFPNHIKIDVDGIEELILLGAKKTLLNSLLKSVLVELETNDASKESYNRCLSILNEAGFSLSKIGGAQIHGLTLRPTNHIFVRKTNW